MWPDTFVVEKNLVNLIAEIRQALGDDSGIRASSAPSIASATRFESLRRRQSEKVQVAHKARFRLVWAEGRAGIGDGEHVLGRDPDLELFLDSPSVSRRHALIRVMGEEATVEDLGSKNGTFIADRRVESPTRLADGDVIRVGSVPVTLKVLAAWGSTHTEPHTPE